MTPDDIRELRVQIVRFADNHQPGFVECQFKDADGRTHTLLEKAPVVSVERLGADSSYPTQGAARCKELCRWTDDDGRELARIDTEIPDEIDSGNGRSKFVVLVTQLKPHHALEELLAASDYSTPQPAEEREWIDAPRFGKELL